MEQIIFLTLFLGLSSGPASVVLQPGANVRSLRLELDGREVARLQHAPWSARIDFGEGLVPHRLSASGYDAAGNEVARGTQLVNVPRNDAEVEIVIKPEGDQRAAAELVAKELTHTKPAEAHLSVDGEDVPVGAGLRARLPKLDASRPHILSAMIRFEDGLIARREAVIDGNTLGESVSSELTPVLVRSLHDFPRKIDGCLSAGDAAIRVTALEKTTPLVVVVKDPDARDIAEHFGTTSQTLQDKWALRNGLRLGERDTAERLIWPVADDYSSASEPTYRLFHVSADVTAEMTGMLSLVTYSLGGTAHEWTQPRHYADAVAVAGLDAFSSGRRRAVVLVLGRKPDVSQHSPAVVRRYLETIGVPLFVWSVDGVRESDREWGEVRDISTMSKFIIAVSALDRELAAQRIAWVSVDRLAALQLTAKCGLETVARLSR
jgi:hypothetical protein